MMIEEKLVLFYKVNKAKSIFYLTEGAIKDVQWTVILVVDHVVHKVLHL